MLQGKNRRWQRLVILVFGLVLVVGANRRIRSEAANAPSVGLVSYVDTNAPAAGTLTAHANEPDTESGEPEDEAVAEPDKTVVSTIGTEVSAEVLGAARTDTVETLTASGEAVTSYEEKVEELIDFEASHPYALSVNRIANTVTVYGIDENGEYTIPYKAFVCSAGQYAIFGTYYTSKGQEWGALYGGVYAQYSTRVSGPILFHSVPYLRYGDPSSLKPGEYNKLGSLASLGCFRLSVEDAKWIFDNCPAGTMVTIYDDENNPGPLGKPLPVRVDPDDERSGWDPTDPDPDNPWT